VFLHKEANFHNYHYFLSHISAKLASSISDIDVILPTQIEVGSNDEKAVTGTHKSHRRSISEFKMVIMYQTLKRQYY
jgi:hypothetical protein